jgi:hypothetical protein
MPVKPHTRRVYKYRINYGPDATLIEDCPRTAVFTHAEIIGDDVWAWALVPVWHEPGVGNQEPDRPIGWFNTGDDIPLGWKHVGSAVDQAAGQVIQVVHVFDGG